MPVAPAALRPFFLTMKLAPINMEELTAKSSPLVRSDRGVGWSKGGSKVGTLLMLLHHELCAEQLKYKLSFAECMTCSYQFASSLRNQSSKTDGLGSKRRYSTCKNDVQKRRTTNHSVKQVSDAALMRTARLCSNTALPWVGVKPPVVVMTNLTRALSGLSASCPRACQW